MSFSLPISRENISIEQVHLINWLDLFWFNSADIILTRGRGRDLEVDTVTTRQEIVGAITNSLQPPILIFLWAEYFKNGLMGEKRFGKCGIK